MSLIEKVTFRHKVCEEVSRIYLSRRQTLQAEEEASVKDLQGMCLACLRNCLRGKGSGLHWGQTGKDWGWAADPAEPSRSL